tara:strand:+ start:2006 stop:2326 length:321 start_codon:yes stop_codon:yes gene_type:complete
MKNSELSKSKKMQILLSEINGNKSINESLSKCPDSESMIEILLNISSKLKIGLSRNDLTTTPPIRDWIWWKNKEAIITIGSGKPRYQQDSISKVSKFNKFISSLFQ